MGTGMGGPSPSQLAKPGLAGMSQTSPASVLAMFFFPRLKIHAFWRKISDKGDESQHQASLNPLGMQMRILDVRTQLRHYVTCGVLETHGKGEKWGSFCYPAKYPLSTKQGLFAGSVS